MKKRTFKKVWLSGNSLDKEVNTLPSETVPNQALSMREILHRFASGLAPDVQRPTEFSDDMPDLRFFDISELHDMQKAARQDVKDIKDELQRRKTEKQDPSPAPSPTVEPPKTEES